MGKLITPDMAVSDLFELSGKRLNEENNLNGEFDDDDGNQYSPYLISDIEEHIGTITAMENKITDLTYLVDDIKKAKGMNQNFALEAEYIEPNILNTPIGYYTKDTTATRYKITLEELSAKIWMVIAAAAAALVTLIAKFINWLFSSSSSGSSGSGSGIGGSKINSETHEEIKENIEDVKRELHDIGEVKVDIPTTNLQESTTQHVYTDNGTVVQVTPNMSLSEIITNIINNAEPKIPDNSSTPYINTILEGTDRYTNDILNNGDYSKNMSHVATTKITYNIKKSLKDILDNLYYLLSTDMVNKLEAGKDVVFKMPKSLPIGVADVIPDVNDITPFELVDSIKRVRATLESNEHIHYNKYHSLDEIYIKFIAAYNGFNYYGMHSGLKDIRNLYLAITDNLNRAENISDKLDRSNEIAKEYSIKLRDLIKAIKLELKNVNEYVKEVSFYSDKIGNLGIVLINKIPVEITKEVEKRVREANISIPNGFIKIRKLLELKKV